MTRALGLALLLLAGCTFGPTRAELMAKYVGADEAALVQALGVPNRTYTAGDVKFLAYDESRTEILPPLPGPMWGWGLGYGYAWGSPFPPSIVQYSCETTFEVAQGRVRSFSLRGNACG